MFRKDFLQRQFEEFGKVLASLLSLKKSKAWEEFEKQAEEASKKFTTFELKELESHTASDFKNKVINTPNLSYDQKKILASLLFEKMKVYEELVMQEKYLSVREKSLILYDHLANELMQSEYDLEVNYRLKFLKG